MIPELTANPAEDLALVGVLDEVTQALRQRIAMRDWLPQPTRRQLDDKLRTVARVWSGAQVGGTNFEVRANQFCRNTLLARRAQVANQFAALGTRPDRQRWTADAAWVNVYYNPVYHQLLLSRELLRLPNLRSELPVAVTLGSLGFLAGHALVHAVDEVGSQFDSRGRLAAKWSNGLRSKLSERTFCLEQQYSNLVPPPGAPIDGALTADEIAADIAAVRAAFLALVNLRSRANVHYRANGLTEPQLFFLSFAQTWCHKQRPSPDLGRAYTGAQPPPRWRVNGALSNAPEFAQAFDCPAGAPLRVQRICELW